MQATIEIDLGPLANEWEAVEYRVPLDGETWITPEGGIANGSNRHAEIGPRLIVRRKWTWPSWLKARWYAEDADGSQLVTNKDTPTIGNHGWRSSMYFVYPAYVDIPKIGGDWRQSLRENPNWRSDNGQKDT